MAGRNSLAPQLVVALLLGAACLQLAPCFVGGPAKLRTTQVSLSAAAPKRFYDERDPLPKGYGIRTGLSDLLKPLNSEYGVTAKEESLGTYVVLLTAIVLL